MTPSDLLTNVVCPTLAKLAERWGDHIDSQAARLLLTAIAIQESGLRTRVQDDNGPGHGLWQFEPEGVADVMKHPVSGPVVDWWLHPAGVTESRTPGMVYDLLGVAPDDIACVLARALLLTDPKPLPDIGDEEGAWLYYQRNWRPGKPDRARWTESYHAAMFGDAE